MTSWQRRGWFTFCLSVLKYLLFFIFLPWLIFHATYEPGSHDAKTVLFLSVRHLVVTLSYSCSGVLCSHKWTETRDTCWNELIVACSALCAPCWPTPPAEISTNGSDCKSFWSRSSMPSSSNARMETGNCQPGHACPAVCSCLRTHNIKGELTHHVPCQ